jgi:hypothetical protein
VPSFTKTKFLFVTGEDDAAVGLLALAEGDVVGLGDAVAPALGVTDGVGVTDGEGVTVGVGVGVGVGDGEPGTTAPPTAKPLRQT